MKLFDHIIGDFENEGYNGLSKEKSWFRRCRHP